MLFATKQYMEENLLSGLIDPKIEKILKVFLQNKEQFFHLKKISAQSKVPLTTTFSITKKLACLGIISVSKIGKLKLYKIAENKKTSFLEAVLIKNG